jgi:hypothetical protein
MIWYEIPGLPGYRINYHAEVLSMKGAEPRVLKPYRRHWVRLCHNGCYLTLTTGELLDRAGLHVPSAPSGGRDSCAQGHLFTPQNTMRRINRGRVIRKCRRCHAEAMARYRAKKKAQGVKGFCA